MPTVRNWILTIEYHITLNACFSFNVVGKSGVKLLHIKRDGPVHSIRELDVSTQLTLSSKKDYTAGKNLMILKPSEILENTVIFQVIILTSSPLIPRKIPSTSLPKSMVSIVLKSLPSFYVAIF